MIATLNDWGAAWAGWFGWLVLQNTVFLGLVFLALHALRDASARVRAAVATIGVLKLALPPFLTVALLTRGAAETVPPAVSTLLFPFRDGAVEPAAGPAWSGGLTLAAAAMLAWASVTLARIGWVALQTLQLAWAVRGATSVPAHELPADVRRSGLVIKRAPGIPMPLSFGPWPRTVYVPAVWDRWARANREAVLRHELAHVRRRDGLVLSLEILVQAVYFFHPLVRLLIRRLRTWREMACDDASLSADPAARLAYTRFLADLAESALVPARATESASTLLRGGSELKSRVIHQIKEGVMNPVPKSRVILVAALLLAAIVPLSLVLADPAPAPPPPPAKPAPQAVPLPDGQQAAEAQVKPADAPRPDTPPPPPPEVRVVIREAGIAVNGEPVTEEEFSDLVRKNLQIKGEDAVVTIDADGGVTMDTLHQVQKVLLALELNKVVYKGETGSKLPLVLPPEKAKQALAKLPEEDLVRVKVDGKGVLTVDGRKTAGADLPDVVSKRLEKRSTVVFVLQTERDTTYGAFVQVLDGLKSGGATRIAVDDPGR